MSRGYRNDYGTLIVFDFAAQTWKQLATGSFDYPAWSPDSEYVYVNDSSKERLIRIQRTTGKQEDVLDLKTVDANALMCRMMESLPNQSMLLGCALIGGDIYALDLNR